MYRLRRASRFRVGFEDNSHKPSEPQKRHPENFIYRSGHIPCSLFLQTNLLQTCSKAPYSPNDLGIFSVTRLFLVSPKPVSQGKPQSGPFRRST